MVRDHRQHDGQRQVRVVHGAALRIDAALDARRPLFLLRADQLPVGRDDHEQDARDHDRPQHRPDLDEGAPAAEELAGAPGGERGQAHDRDPEDDLVADRPAEEVVDDPGEHEPGEAGPDRDRLREVGHGRVDQVRVGLQVVEEDEQREPGDPRPVRLPLEPVQRLGEPRRRGQVLLHVVEAAAVHGPELTVYALLGIPALARPLERGVEEDEVDRRADPGDPGDHVRPADQQVEPVGQVGIEPQDHPRLQRSSAIATSSPSAVSSSSSVGLPIRERSTSRISAFGPAIDEDDEAEAVPRLVLGVQALELGKDGRVVVRTLLGGGARRESGRADGRVRIENLTPLARGQVLHRHTAGLTERILQRSEPLDEARPPLEELGELLGAQLPR